MTTRRIATTAFLLASALLAGGCTTFNDRFYVPGRDPVLTLMGAKWDTNVREWPAAQLPELRPLRTELIPDRLPPPGIPPIGWPPL